MLATRLRDQVLTAFGFSDLPSIDEEGLSQIYDAWCRNVPFDNLRKLIHVRAQNPAPLPGSTADDFFTAWLAHRTGGTCWAGNGALCSLLQSIGFDSSRGVATMLVSPTLPPNHGTVVVRLPEAKHLRLCDASILHRVPIELAPSLPHAKLSHNVQLSLVDGKWVVRWIPAHLPNGLDCRIEYFPTDDADFQARHDATRGWSPFNYLPVVRTIRGRCAVGVYGSDWYQLSSDGQVEKRSLTVTERAEMLVNQLGYSEEIVSQLPKDEPIPPPPGSETAKSETRNYV